MDRADRVGVIHGNTVASVRNDGNTPRSVSISIGYGTEVASIQNGNDA